MRPRLRVLRPALLLTTALLLSSCGIPETGVVEAGEPATGIRPVQVLYFVSAGKPFAVHRQTSGRVGIETAVEMLFGGPDVLERSRGMTTELPSLTGAPTVRTDGGEVSIELPWGTGPLTGTAITQLTCTAAEADLDPASVTGTAMTKVTITVPDAWSAEGSSETCPSAAGAGSRPNPSPTSSGAVRNPDPAMWQRGRVPRGSTPEIRGSGTVRNRYGAARKTT